MTNQKEIDEYKVLKQAYNRGFNRLTTFYTENEK